MSRKHANTVVGLTMPEFITPIEKHGITSEQPQQRGKRRQETTIAGGPRCSPRRVLTSVPSPGLLRTWRAPRLATNQSFPGNGWWRIIHAFETRSKQSSRSFRGLTRASKYPAAFIYPDAQLERRNPRP